VKFVILTSKPDSAYADTQTSYEYPAQYRSFFEPLERGESMLAIIYEPRGGRAGRMAYVGWAALSTAPSLSSRKTDRGRPLWEVRYVDRVQEFPTPVPRDLVGEPIEAWLRLIPPEHRAIRTSGASVRQVLFEDAQRILELGHSGELLTTAYGLPDDHRQTDELVAERATRLVRRRPHPTSQQAGIRFRVQRLGPYSYAPPLVRRGPIHDRRIQRWTHRDHVASP
jgi:hypothetical protein